MTKKLRSKKGPADHGKGGGEEVKEKITEVDKEWFQIQIKSLEERLQRRNEKMRQLEQSNADYQEKYGKLCEDKADIIAYLKRTLQQRTDQISEFQARLEGLQQVHRSDAELHQQQKTSLEQEATRMKEQLVSENMVLTKKLDALEEFRIQRDQLMLKFEEQEKKQESLKLHYEHKLEAMEKRHILEEDRLKKDMIVKLESVASEFRKASHAQMAATTQRTIRENVSVSAQVGILSEKAAELNVENEDLEDQNRNLKKLVEALEVEQKKLMQRNAYRLKVIEELSARCSSQEERLQHQGSFHVERKQLEDRINRLESELEEANTSLQTNAFTVREKESTISDIKIKLAGMSRTKDMINGCLTEASGSIKEALALQSNIEFDSEQEADIKSTREKVLNQLLLMLNTAIGETKKDQSALKKEKEEKDDVEYLHGSLGLVPIE